MGVRIMDRIVCLVGESGSGKSTIAERLKDDGFNYIQSYTTRKPRFEGEKGHIFVDITSIDQVDILEEENFTDNDDIIAYTFFDREHYWATKEQYKDKGDSIYIVDPVGTKELRKRIKDAEIVVIYIRVDESIRFNRMYKRDKLRYENTSKRIAHDREAFKIVECNYIVDGNRSIEEVLKDIKSLI